jgi:hypothetical protein
MDIYEENHEIKNKKIMVFKIQFDESRTRITISCPRFNASIIIIRFTNNIYNVVFLFNQMYDYLTLSKH